MGGETEEFFAESQLAGSIRLTKGKRLWLFSLRGAFEKQT